MVTLILRSVSKLSKLSRSIYDFWHGLVTEKCLKTDLDLQRFTFHLMLWFSEGILVKLSSQTVGESKFVIFLVKYCWNKVFAIKLLFTSFSKPVPVLFTRQWTCEGSNSFQYERFYKYSTEACFEGDVAWNWLIPIIVERATMLKSEP